MVQMSSFDVEERGRQHESMVRGGQQGCGRGRRRDCSVSLIAPGPAVSSCSWLSGIELVERARRLPCGHRDCGQQGLTWKKEHAIGLSRLCYLAWEVVELLLQTC